MICPQCQTEMASEGEVLDALTFEVVAERFVCPVDRSWVHALVGEPVAPDA